MKILIAPNAFKGTMQAQEAAEIIELAIRRNLQESICIKSPIADGGDGTFVLLARELGLPIEKRLALDPLGRPVEGCFSVDKKSGNAFMDVSTVSGVKWLAQEERDPFVTSTYGTGELITAAIAKGASKIHLGLGGSASIDMGVGILRALGFVFLDGLGREVPMFSPGFLSKIQHIQRPIQKHEVQFTLLCDVQNPFFGPNGAVAVYGTQKGLESERQQEMDKACLQFFSLLKNKSPHTLEDQHFFGAAGGVAVGLSAFFPTQTVKGPEFFFDKVGMAQKVNWADLVITGEGRYDSQSSAGKGSYELMRLCQSQGKRVKLITSGDTPGKGFEDTIFLPPLPQKGDSEAAKKFLFEAVKAYFKKTI